jgi:hypothetical protein
MNKAILSALVFVFCICFPPAGIFIALVVLSRRGCKSRPVSFPAGRLESKKKEQTPDFITTEETQKRNIDKIVKPGYDAWSPENRERTLLINKVVEENRRKADEEMREEIRREQEAITRKNVETIVSEYIAKQAKERSIQVK